jgi:hypothetical protein
VLGPLVKRVFSVVRGIKSADTRDQACVFGDPSIESGGERPLIARSASKMMTLVLLLVRLNG